MLNTEVTEVKKKVSVDCHTWAGFEYYHLKYEYLKSKYTYIICVINVTSWSFQVQRWHWSVFSQFIKQILLKLRQRLVLRQRPFCSAVERLIYTLTHLIASSRHSSLTDQLSDWITEQSGDWPVSQSASLTNHRVADQRAHNTTQLMTDWVNKTPPFRWLIDCGVVTLTV